MVRPCAGFFFAFFWWSTANASALRPPIEKSVPLMKQVYRLSLEDSTYRILDDLLWSDDTFFISTVLDQRSGMYMKLRACDAANGTIKWSVTSNASGVPGSATFYNEYLWHALTPTGDILLSADSMRMFKADTGAEFWADILPILGPRPHQNILFDANSRNVFYSVGEYESVGPHAPAPAPGSLRCAFDGVMQWTWDGKEGGGGFGWCEDVSLPAVMTPDSVVVTVGYPTRSWPGVVAGTVTATQMSNMGSFPQLWSYESGGQGCHLVENPTTPYAIFMLCRSSPNVHALTGISRANMQVPWTTNLTDFQDGTSFFVDVGLSTDGTIFFVKEETFQGTFMLHALNVTNFGAVLWKLPVSSVTTSADGAVVIDVDRYHQSVLAYDGKTGEQKWKVIYESTTPVQAIVSRDSATVFVCTRNSTTGTVVTARRVTDGVLIAQSLPISAEWSASLMGLSPDGTTLIAKAKAGATGQTMGSYVFALPTSGW